MFHLQVLDMWEGGGDKHQLLDRDIQITVYSYLKWIHSLELLCNDLQSSLTTEIYRLKYFRNKDTQFLKSTGLNNVQVRDSGGDFNDTRTIKSSTTSVSNTSQWCKDFKYNRYLQLLESILRCKLDWLLYLSSTFQVNFSHSLKSGIYNLYYNNTLPVCVYIFMCVLNRDQNYSMKLNALWYKVASCEWEYFGLNGEATSNTYIFVRVCLSVSLYVC